MEGEFLYPAPRVKWYPGAHVLRPSHGKGFIYPCMEDGTFCEEVSKNRARTHLCEGPDFDSQVTEEDEETLRPPIQSLTGRSKAEEEAQRMMRRRLVTSEYGPESLEVEDVGTSFYTEAASEGFDWSSVVSASRGRGNGGKRRASTTIPSTIQEEQQQQQQKEEEEEEESWLEVTIEAALDFPPADFHATQHFFCKAFYPGEGQIPHVPVRTKVTEGKIAEFSDPEIKEGLQSCVFNETLRLPFSRFQQFLFVALFQFHDGQELPCGEATVALAEVSAKKASSWAMALDASFRGRTVLRVRMPNEDEDDDDGGAGPRGSIPESKTDDANTPQRTPAKGAMPTTPTSVAPTTSGCGPSTTTAAPLTPAARASPQPMASTPSKDRSKGQGEGERDSENCAASVRKSRTSCSPSTFLDMTLPANLSLAETFYGDAHESSTPKAHVVDNLPPLPPKEWQKKEGFFPAPPPPPPRRSQALSEISHQPTIDASKHSSSADRAAEKSSPLGSLVLGPDKVIRPAGSLQATPTPARASAMPGQARTSNATNVTIDNDKSNQYYDSLPSPPFSTRCIDDFMAPGTGAVEAAPDSPIAGLTPPVLRIDGLSTPNLNLNLNLNLNSNASPAGNAYSGSYSFPGKCNYPNTLAASGNYNFGSPCASSNYNSRASCGGSATASTSLTYNSQSSIHSHNTSSGSNYNYHSRSSIGSTGAAVASSYIAASSSVPEVGGFSTPTKTANNYNNTYNYTSSSNSNNNNINNCYGLDLGSAGSLGLQQQTTPVKQSPGYSWPGTQFPQYQLSSFNSPPGQAAPESHGHVAVSTPTLSASTSAALYAPSVSLSATPPTIELQQPQPYVVQTSTPYTYPTLAAAARLSTASSATTTTSAAAMSSYTQTQAQTQGGLVASVPSTPAGSISIQRGAATTPTTITSAWEQNQSQTPGQSYTPSAWSTWLAAAPTTTYH